MTSENKQTFFARLEGRLAPSELAKVKAAYYLAKYGHRAQTRTEKDSEGNNLRYFEHTRRVALILMDEAHVYCPEDIITALLHDILEDTEDIDAAILEQLFGTEVARQVTCLTKQDKETYLDKLRSSSDRVLLIKMCDRLDNLRSLSACSTKFQDKQLRETKEKYLLVFSRLKDSYIYRQITQMVYPNA